MDFKAADRLNINFPAIFAEELLNSTLDDLGKNYFTVAMSHYPIYCSNPNDDH